MTNLQRMMNCPTTNGSKTIVIDSRFGKSGVDAHKLTETFNKLNNRKK